MGGKQIINKCRKLFLKHKDEFLISGLSQFIYMAQSLVQNKLFAVNFDKNGFGTWALFTSIYAFVSMLPFTAVDQGIYSVASKYKSENKADILYNSILFTYNIGFVLYSIVFFVVFLVKRDSFFATGSIIYFLAYTFTEIIKNTFLVIDNAYRKRKHVLIIRIIGFLSRLFLLLALGKIHAFTINHVFLVFFVTNIFMLALLKDYWIHFSSGIPNAELKKLAKHIVAFSSPLMIWAVFGWLQNMIGRWYLNALIDTESVALYTMLVSVSYFVPNAFYTIMNAYVMPLVFTKKEKIKEKVFLGYLGSSCIILTLYFFAVLLFKRIIIYILADPKYLDICDYLPWTTLTSIVYVLAMMSTVEIYHQGNTKTLLIPSILPGLLMSTVGYFIIKQFGLGGAIINYMMGQLLYSVLVFRKSFMAVFKNRSKGSE